MHILHIVGSISPETGGPAEAIRMLLQHAPPGYTAEVVTLNQPSESFIPTLSFPIHALGTGGWYSPRLIPWLQANRSRFDGVILHGLWEFTGVAVLLAIAGHKPYVVFPHGMLDPYFKRAFPAKHAKKWLYWLLADFWVLRSAKRVLFTTQIEADLARESFFLNQWTPMVVPLGAEPPPPNTDRLLEAFSTNSPLLRGHNFLLFLGRLNPKKGPDLLLRAFAALDQDAITAADLHLVMAGPDYGDYTAALRTQASTSPCADRIHWTGPLWGDAKWGALAACEAFILPSHQENFGIAVVEALASSKPVLISNQVNIAPDVLADGCAFVQPDTLDGTRNLLTQWLSTPAESRKAMSLQALRTFNARYNMAHNTERILRVFEAAPEAL